MQVHYFLERLRRHIDLRGSNARALARDAGVGYDVVREIVRGRTKSISVDNAKQLLDALGLSFAEIYADEPPSFAGGFSESKGGMVGVPRFAGDRQKTLDYIPFTPEFFSKKLKLNGVEGLVMCDIKGDSMEPTLGDGDLAMINTQYRGRKSGLYAVNYCGEMFVKRLERVGKGFNLISDNSLYPPIKISGKSLADFEIIGRVVWLGRLL